MDEGRKYVLNEAYFGGLSSVSWAIRWFSTQPSAVLSNQSKLLLALREFRDSGLQGNGNLYRDFVLCRHLYADCSLWVPKRLFALQHVPWMDIGIQAIAGEREHLTYAECPPDIRAPAINGWFCRRRGPDREQVHPEGGAAATTPSCQAPTDYVGPHDERLKADVLRLSRHSCLWTSLQTRDRQTMVWTVLAECFAGADKVDTTKIGGLPGTNPFAALLRGEARDEVFEDAEQCLQSRAFCAELKRQGDGDFQRVALGAQRRIRPTCRCGCTPRSWVFPTRSSTTHRNGKPSLPRRRQRPMARTVGTASS